MGPGEPREPGGEGAQRPRDDDSDFILGRDDADGADPADPDRPDFADAPTFADGTTYGTGPDFAESAGYADSTGYAQSAGYGRSSGYPQGAGYTESAGYGQRADYGEDDGRGTRVRDDPPFLPPEFTEEELEGLRGDASGLPRGPRRVLPLEDEPTTLVARYLFPTERYRGEWKRHWIHLSTPLLVGVGATLALGYLAGFFAKQQVDGLTTVVVLIWLGIMGWVGWKVGDWYFDRFILTNKRVMVVSGIITRKVAMMPLLRVTDMKYEQSALGRMLNYGTFVLESAGQDQALREVKHLPNPNELYLRVVEEMYEPQAVEARLGKDSDAGDDA